jgi:hypothetical protein
LQRFVENIPEGEKEFLVVDPGRILEFWNWEIGKSLQFEDPI